jgi:hypothetical protein
MDANENVQGFVLELRAPRLPILKGAAFDLILQVPRIIRAASRGSSNPG